MSDSSASADAGPFAEQRRIFDLLSQETRHHIIQNLLGHPEHLMSLDELEFMLPKSKATIKAQLDNLIEADILALYSYGPSEETRDLPSQFYGFTEHGIEILYDYKYLRGLPVARALYEKTRKDRKIERHEAAPRPDLPETVAEALEFDEPASEEAGPNANTQSSPVDADRG